MIKKQTVSSLHPLEKTLIIISIVLIGIVNVAYFGQLIIFVTSYLYTPLLIANFTVLIRKKRAHETLLRILFVLNVIAIAASVYLIFGWNVN